MFRPLSSLAVLAVVNRDDRAKATGAQIAGQIRYGGPVHGKLRVAAFTAFPPRGRPAALAVIDEPKFPQPYTLRGLPPGRYFILATLDVDERGSDPFSIADSPRMVTVDEAAQVDLELAPTFVVAKGASPGSR